MRLSVIIPTCNRSNLLQKALDSLVRQSLPGAHFEILVVDNGSTDATQQVIASCRERFLHFRDFYDATPGLHVGRNLGLKFARGEILVFADDDIQACSTWLEGIAEAFRDPSVALVGGKILPDFEVPPPDWFESLWADVQWGRTLGYYTLLDFGDEATEISPQYVWGCNFSIRRDVLREWGGFHPDAMPGKLIRFRGDGETAISRKVAASGMKAVYSPKATVYHWVSKDRLSLEYLQKRAFAQGVSDSYTLIRHRRLGGGGENREWLLAIRRLLQKVIVLLPFRRNRLQELLRMSYHEGFRFHQREARLDPSLVTWICKPSYLD